MDRRTGIRLTIAAGLAIGLSFSVAPQLVAGATSAGSTGSGEAVTDAPATLVSSVDDQVWAIDLHAAAPPTPGPRTAPIVAPETEDAVSDAPDVQVTPTPAPEPTLVEAPAPVTPAPAPVVEETVTNTGTIHVDVATTEGASRSVSLETADGSLVGGPVAVDGSRITFSDVADGTYDLFVEQTADGGGTFLTRTTLVVAGDDIVVTCDAESLDCTVA